MNAFQTQLDILNPQLFHGSYPNLLYNAVTKSCVTSGKFYKIGGHRD